MFWLVQIFSQCFLTLKYRFYADMKSCLIQIHAEGRFTDLRNDVFQRVCFLPDSQGCIVPFFRGTVFAYFQQYEMSYHHNLLSL